MATSATAHVGREERREGLLVKTRESEYLIDRLNADIAALEDRVEGLIEENKSLYEECKFTAVLALVLGVCIGVIIGTVVAWR